MLVDTDDSETAAAAAASRGKERFMYDDTRHRDPWENTPFLLEDDPILPEGWERDADLFDGSHGGAAEGKEEGGGAVQSGTGAGDRQGAGVGGGAGRPDVFRGGTAARVGADGTAGAYPADAGGGPGREPVPLPGRGLGAGDVLPSGDGETGPGSMSEAMREAISETGPSGGYYPAGGFPPANGDNSAGGTAPADTPGPMDGAAEGDGASLRDKNTDTGGNPPSANDTQTPNYDGFSSPEARLRAQAQAARVLYPELRDLSDRDAVAVAVGGGGTLGAYADFRARENARLRQENALLRQNRDTLRRAPVRGVSGGAVRTRARDPFETGFDEDGW